MKLKMKVIELRNPSEMLGSNSRLPLDLVGDRQEDTTCVEEVSTTDVVEGYVQPFRYTYICSGPPMRHRIIRNFANFIV